MTACALWGIASAHAQELLDRRPRHEARESSEVSLDQAVRMAQRRYHAKAVRAETVRSGNRRMHQIRLLNSEGKVWTVYVDADSGDMN
ncbi:hypothetical protein ACG33_08170 [Steroidobacter denitrificans]|uniref:PepSY domain-containing protein n=2 Tax=Steroidobacter denitrificans TaxID=465721 RepID=A0A127FBT2_STEDE|nr:hypothetical protein ACG33_08170 [Steroidobacter denitrificans]